MVPLLNNIGTDIACPGVSGKSWVLSRLELKLDRIMISTLALLNSRN